MAKHYIKKKRDPNSYYRKESRCWTCQNCFGGCEWSREFNPVPGWTAKKTCIPSNGEYKESYNVLECPKYMEDKRI